MSKLKRIGILTGGGDCPGLNAVIRSVASSAIAGGMEVIGIEDGYLGLIEERSRLLKHDDICDIITRGGTILGSCNKANPAAYAIPDGKGGWITRDVRDQVVEHYGELGLDALVVIGGDGTMCGANDLITRGLKIIGIPKTIDNDLWGTDYTFGHDTAVATATGALDKISTTASSHHRVMVMELMGRYAGWIALHAGVASGAQVILIPEIPFDLEKISQFCLDRSKVGRRYTIIAAGEGAIPAGGEQFIDHIDKSSPDPIRLGGIAKFVSDEIFERTNLDTRHIVLGHIQRGGTPTSRDRILGTVFGNHAFKLLQKGMFNRLVVARGREISDVPIEEIAGKVRKIPDDSPVLEAAFSIGINFGK